MPSLLPFIAPRTKRKMSSLDRANSLDDDFDLIKTTSMSPSLLSGATSSTVSRTFCAVDWKEVLGFLVFEALTVLIVVLGCLDWILFFKFVVEPEDPREKAKWGSIWLVFTMSVLYFRAIVRSKADQNMRMMADHAEIFVAVSMVMVFSTNIAFLIHTPSSVPLRDLGFMLIPEQAVDSKWRPLSDILTAAVPVFFFLQSHLMSRENRCRIITTFFRVASVAYGLRMCTVSLTSLPGPAPHCRPGSPNYFPPQNWIDVVTRIGPMYGNYNSCGDLIFSGHMAYTTSAVLLYLRVLDRYFPRFSRTRWVVGAIYLAVLAGLCVSGRKHYTVDVVLGVIIASLVFFHFEHSWTPLWLHPQPMSRQVGAYQPSYGLKTPGFAIEVVDDDEAMDEFDDSDRLLPGLNGRMSIQDKKTPVDFIC